MCFPIMKELWRMFGDGAGHSRWRRHNPRPKLARETVLMVHYRQGEYVSDGQPFMRRCAVWIGAMYREETVILFSARTPFYILQVQLELLI